MASVVPLLLVTLDFSAGVRMQPLDDFRGRREPKGRSANYM